MTSHNLFELQCCKCSKHLGMIESSRLIFGTSGIIQHIRLKPDVFDIYCDEHAPKTSTIIEKKDQGV